MRETFTTELKKIGNSHYILISPYVVDKYVMQVSKKYKVTITDDNEKKKEVESDEIQEKSGSNNSGGAATVPQG